MNTRKALDKITEWQAAAGQLRNHLPIDDQVLMHWYRMLIEFKQNLPLLHKLSNDALKVMMRELMLMSEELEFNSST